MFIQDILKNIRQENKQVEPFNQVLQEASVKDIKTKGFNQFLEKYSKPKLPNGLKKSNLYVRFADSPMNKMSVKPNHQDPIGVYAYPLEFVINHPASIKYGSRSNWIQILQAVDVPYPITKLSLSRAKNLIYMAGADVRLFERMLSQSRKNPRKVMMFGAMTNHIGQAFMWAMTHDGPEDLDILPPIKQRQRFLQAGLYCISDNASDYGKASINENEPQQTIFFDKSSYKFIEAIYVGGAPSSDASPGVRTANTFSGTSKVKDKIIGVIAQKLNLNISEKLSTISRFPISHVSEFNIVAWLGKNREYFVGIEDVFIPERGNKDSRGDYRQQYASLKHNNEDGFLVKLVGPAGSVSLQSSQMSAEEMANQLISNYENKKFDSQDHTKDYSKASFQKKIEDQQSAIEAKNSAEDNYQFDKYVTPLAKFFKMPIPELDRFVKRKITFSVKNSLLDLANTSKEKQLSNLQELEDGLLSMGNVGKEEQSPLKQFQYDPKAISWCFKILRLFVDYIYDKRPDLKPRPIGWIIQTIANEELKEGNVEEDDYRDEHKAPTRGDGYGPIWYLKDIYGDDIYSAQALRMFGTSEKPSEDMQAIGIISSCKNKPNSLVTVYRAVPMNLDKSKKKIFSGDWVSLTRSYAKEHGQSNLNNEFVIVSKKVFARDLFTDGNSLQEWGYDPQPKGTDNDKLDTSWTLNDTHLFLRGKWISELQGRGVEFKVVGSVATKGKSSNNLNVLIIPTKDIGVDEIKSIVRKHVGGFQKETQDSLEFLFRGTMRKCIFHIGKFDPSLIQEAKKNSGVAFESREFGPLYHGTNEAESIQSFKSGSTFTSSKELAQSYITRDNGRLYEVTIEMSNPYVLNARGKNMLLFIRQQSKQNTSDPYDYFLGSVPFKYDGMIIKNTYDPALRGGKNLMDIKSDIYFPRHSKQTTIIDSEVITESVSSQRKVVSFDFDGVIHLDVDYNGSPYDYESGDMEPHDDIIKIMRQEAVDHDIIIVTARGEESKELIEDYVKKHKLPVQEVICTNMWKKSDYLSQFDVVRHYDDNPHVWKDLKDNGIPYVKVVNGEIQH